MEKGSWKYSGEIIFVVGSDNTEINSWGRGVCWGHGGIKLNR